jgi:hypothetical protein
LLSCFLTAFYKRSDEGGKPPIVVDSSARVE